VWTAYSITQQNASFCDNACVSETEQQSILATSGFGFDGQITD